jgi:anion-transporting  ArsA/GET3 family ATPase
VSALADTLEGAGVVVCVGAGGVGKTTVSAALALGLAHGGARVAVITIDPARRLADALGVGPLGNEPQRVDLGGGDADGELWAMMLDAKLTFDELIGRLAPDAATREAILADPIYQQLSTAIGGAQEYTAMAKLYDLVTSGGFDVVVLDTAPSRNAMDFLNAPDRLLAFLEGRAVRTLLVPGGALARVGAGGAGMALRMLRRLLGVDLLGDVAVFLGEISGLLGAFAARSRAVRRLLDDPRTRCVVVTTPTSAAVREAEYLCGELRRSGLAVAGVVVNRVQPVDPAGADPARVSARLSPVLGEALARRVAERHAWLQQLARRDASSVERLRARLGNLPVATVADRAAAVHDLAGLALVERQLFGTVDQAELMRQP